LLPNDSSNIIYDFYARWFGCDFMNIKISFSSTIILYYFKKM
jgi:hypothetical protein